MAYYVYNETPVGAIDGVNTTFTLLYNIEKIVDLELNGVEYRDFSFSGNTLVLQIAPPIGAVLYVDYFGLVGTANTLDQIVERVYTILGENPNGPNYVFPKDTLVIPMINEVQEDIVKGEAVHFATGETFKGGDMRFLRKQFFITAKIPQQNTAPIFVGDTTIDVGDTTYYETSGSVCINTNVITYTNKNATQLLGVQHIEKDFAQGNLVYQVWQLPQNATFPFQMVQINQRSTNQVIPLDVPYKDFRYVPMDDQPYMGWYFTVIGDNFSQANQYVMLGGRPGGLNSNTNDFVVYYYENAGAMVVGTDYTALPGDYGKKVIAPIVAGNLLYITDEQAKGERIGNMGYGALKNMYNVYSKQAKQFKKSVKINPILKSGWFTNTYGGWTW